MTVRNPTAHLRASRSNSIVRQFLISHRKNKLNGIRFDDVLELLAGMIYLAVHRTVARYAVPPFLTEDDLVQEGRVTLLLCLQNFKLDNLDANFTSYFRRALYNNLRHAVLKASHGGQDPSLTADPLPLDDGQGDPTAHTYWPPELTYTWTPDDGAGASMAVEVTRRVIVKKEPLNMVAQDLHVDLTDALCMVETVLAQLVKANRKAKRDQNRAEQAAPIGG